LKSEKPVGRKGRQQLQRIRMQMAATDKFDLLDHYARAVYELLNVPLESGAQKSNKMEGNQILQGLIRILDHIQANARFYRVMLGKNRDPVFTDKIRQYIQKRIRRSLPAVFKMTKFYWTFISITVPMPLWEPFCGGSNAIVHIRRRKWRSFCINSSPEI
jgi:hypothetical protein